MHRPFRIAAIGELLWDFLPDGPQLGGAPANFASSVANLTSVGSAEPPDEVFLISRVGDDSLGRHALDQLRAHRILSEFVSVDPKHATGSVTVTFHAEMQPEYTIHEDVAWDFIPWKNSLARLGPTLDAICFGTLAQRSPLTRKTLRCVIDATRPDCVRIFDVNLRPPYWIPEMLAWGCERATAIKMNEEEVPHIARLVDPPGVVTDPLAIARLLLRRFPIKLVAITRGARGCLLVTHDAVCDRSGIAVEVVDSIGAGDAFTACLASTMLRRLPLPAIAETSNNCGAWVATQRGGMPIPDENARLQLYTRNGYDAAF